MMNRVLLAGIMLCCCLASAAQTSVSPYSMFGIGVIDDGDHGANSGMAGLGIGVREENVLNTANPASLTSLQPKTFVMDIAAAGSISGFHGHGGSAWRGSGNIDRAAFGFRIGSFVSAAMGLAPFSMVEYKIGKETFIEGRDGTYSSWFTGSGGLHKIHISLGFDVFRDLSVGLSGSIIMGQITSVEESDYWTSTVKSVSGITPYLDFGIQYHRNLGRYSSITAGVTGSYRKDFSMHNTYSLTDSNDSTTVAETVKPTARQSIPAYIGGGISFSARKFTVGVDYMFHKWSAIDSGSDFLRYKDMNRLTVGLRYTPDRYDVRRYWKHISFLFGVSADDSYLTVSGVSGTDWTVTAGMILPIRNSTSFYWSLKYERNSFPLYNRNTITENSIRLTVGLSFGETWFERKRYN